MEGVTFSKPLSFSIPAYDFQAVKAVAKATDLQPYFKNLLHGSMQSDEDDFTYGLSPKVIKRLVERLVDGFDWQEWRQRLQQMGNHHKINVKGLPDQEELEAHFVHRRSPNPKAIPLLLVHGWPGSILEFYKIVELLQEDYHVVMPSLPGYAWSGAPKIPTNKPGGAPLDFYKTGLCLNAVMQSLGYDKYVAQGGDWGSSITRYMAIKFPDNVQALHLNLFMSASSPSNKADVQQFTEEEQKGADRLKAFRAKGTAYFEMQGTTPYTLGGVLACSPISLIIYIAEKMFRWSSPESHPTDDEILANCLIYWFTGSITSSFWLYYLRRSGDTTDTSLVESEKIQQPFAFGCGHDEIHWPTRHAVESQAANLLSWKVLGKGGHFLALEEPKELAADIDRAFQDHRVKALFA